MRRKERVHWGDPKWLALTNLYITEHNKPPSYMDQIILGAGNTKWWFELPNFKTDFHTPDHNGKENPLNNASVITKTIVPIKSRKVCVETTSEGDIKMTVGDRVVGMVVSGSLQAEPPVYPPPIEFTIEIEKTPGETGVSEYIYTVTGELKDDGSSSSNLQIGQTFEIFGKKLYGNGNEHDAKIKVTNIEEPTFSITGNPPPPNYYRFKFNDPSKEDPDIHQKLKNIDIDVREIQIATQKHATTYNLDEGKRFVEYNTNRIEFMRKYHKE